LEGDVRWNFSTAASLHEITSKGQPFQVQKEPPVECGVALHFLQANSKWELALGLCHCKFELEIPLTFWWVHQDGFEEALDTK